MLLFALIFAAVLLTCVMFISRSALLGFPSAIFWAIAGAQAYLGSTVPWGDIYFFIAFGCLMGMVPFAALGAYALREKHDTIADEEMEHGEPGYFDERKEPDVGNDAGITDRDDVAQPSLRTKKLRERAAQRRSGVVKKGGEFNW